MLLDFLDDVFLLHFALETTQCIFQRFTLLDDYFCHFFNSPPIRFGLVTVRRHSFPAPPAVDYRMGLLASSNQLGA
jgi:hypothetical protein